MRHQQALDEVQQMICNRQTLDREAQRRGLERLEMIGASLNAEQQRAARTLLRRGPTYMHLPLDQAMAMWAAVMLALLLSGAQGTAMLITLMLTVAAHLCLGKLHQARLERHGRTLGLHVPTLGGRPRLLKD